jgi:hypothetical protein
MCDAVIGVFARAVVMLRVWSAVAAAATHSTRTRPVRRPYTAALQSNVS